MTAPALPRRTTAITRKRHLTLVGPGFVPEPATGPVHQPATLPAAAGAERAADGSAEQAADGSAEQAADGSAERMVPAETAGASMRLTARGRAVACALALLVATMLAIGVGAWAGGQQRSADVPGAVEVVDVGPGDTLWQIAGGVAGPGEDVREVIHRIQDLNDMQSGALVAGQQLIVPAG